MKRIALNKKGLEKIRKGRVLIYNREIERAKGSVRPGEVVLLEYNSKPIATAFFNPLSKIAARVISFECAYPDRMFFVKRIEVALSRRRHLSSITNAFRIVHSDADGLSGLIIDMYGKNLVVSFTSAGMDALKGVVVDVLVDLLRPACIYERSDELRIKEGLEHSEGALVGNMPDEFVVEEKGRKFMARPKDGQKTGFYLDQRKNRILIGSMEWNRVLDLFAHSGAFGIHAGAKFTCFVESSAVACDLIEKNCTMNSVENYTVVKGDVFDFLSNHSETYDLIVIDPPAFAKNRNQIASAAKAYRFLLGKASGLVSSGGYVALFSCSHAFSFGQLADVASEVSAGSRYRFEIVELLKQDVDHPYIASIDTSLYLTGYLLRKWEV